MKERADRKVYVSPQIVTLEANDLIEVLGPASAGSSPPSIGGGQRDPYAGEIGPLPDFL